MNQQLSVFVVLDVFQVLLAFHSPISLKMPLELFFLFVNYAYVLVSLHTNIVTGSNIWVLCVWIKIYRIRFKI